MIWTTDVARWGGALALVGVYALMCGAVLWRHRREQARHLAQQGAARALSDASAATWVLYASQTGEAEQLAWRTAEVLHGAGVPVRVSALDQCPVDELARASAVYVVASTYGEGDPPDNGARFAQHLADAAADAADNVASWSAMRYAVLALGDRHYAQFCGFGRSLDAGFAAWGAQALFDRVEVDQMDETAIAGWFTRVAEQVGADGVPAWQAPTFEDGWVLAKRQLLNAGSPGEGVYHLVLQPPAGHTLDWEAGDLVQVKPPVDPNQPESEQDLRAREYSIASIPQDGAVHLLIRLRRLAEGGVGRVSGWLCGEGQLTAAIGAPVALRLRAHMGFRQADNARRPLLLIGNGTGLAGLRAHLKARAWQRQVHGADQAPACWLVFGERQPDVDLHHHANLQAWLESGVLARLDAVFSRDPVRPQYVQDRLREEAPRVREWVVGQGAAIYVCGSLSGMAGGVDEALRDILGDDTLAALALQGRYRRDVY